MKCVSMNTRRRGEGKREGAEKESLCWVEDRGRDPTLRVRGNEKGKRRLGGEQRVGERRRVVMGGRVGLGHRGRGTLTPAGSPLPFPYTAAPASPGPAPASVWRAADTRPSTGLPWRTMGFCHHHHWLKLLSHDYSHTGMLCYVYTGTHVHTCVCALIHTQWFTYWGVLSWKRCLINFL